MNKYGIECNGMKKAIVGQCVYCHGRWYLVIEREYDHYVCTDLLDEEMRDFDDLDVDLVCEYPCGNGDGI